MGRAGGDGSTRKHGGDAGSPKPKGFLKRLFTKGIRQRSVPPWGSRPATTAAHTSAHKVAVSCAGQTHPSGPALHATKIG